MIEDIKKFLKNSKQFETNKLIFSGFLKSNHKNIQILADMT